MTSAGLPHVTHSHSYNTHHNFTGPKGGGGFPQHYNMVPHYPGSVVWLPVSPGHMIPAGYAPAFFRTPVPTPVGLCPYPTRDLDKGKEEPDRKRICKMEDSPEKQYGHVIKVEPE